MATAKNILKDWFRNKKEPPQEQFWAWIDSYWHKDEKIPVSVVSGLENLLNGTATVESLEALRRQVELLQQLVQTLQNKGMQDGAAIALAANTAKSYVLPSNAMLFAIKVNGTGTVQVSRTENELGDIGEIESTGNAVLQLGLLDVSEVWLQSNAELEAVPIIYKR